MKKPTYLALAGIAACALALTLQAQQRASPPATVEASIEGHAFSISYSRPSAKGRDIWGALVPYGRVWRTGANEATTLVAEADLTIGGTHVPAGTYTLFSIPTADGGQLIINKQTGQWGTRYSEAQDFARVPMTRSANADPVEQFTIAVDEHGTLQLIWADATYSTTVAAP